MYANMDEWVTIRRRVLVEGVSKRQILRETGMHWTTLEKILEHREPPGYQRRREPAKPKIGPFLGWVAEVPKADLPSPRYHGAAVRAGRRSGVSAQGSPRTVHAGWPLRPVGTSRTGCDAPPWRRS